MKLGVKARRVDHALALRIAALEQDGAALLRLIRRSNANGVAEEVADVAAEPEECLIGSVFRLLEIFKSLGGLSPQTRKHSL